MTRDEYCRRPGRTSKWIRPLKRLAIYLRDDFRCVYCRNQPDRTALTLDHLLPRANGGTNDETNLVTACVRCNSARRDRPWKTFVTEPEHIAHIKRQRRRRLPMAKARALLEELRRTT